MIDSDPPEKIISYMDEGGNVDPDTRNGRYQGDTGQQYVLQNANCELSYDPSPASGRFRPPLTSA